ncbi:unnamed protein product, partial [Staurois parvus]
MIRNVTKPRTLHSLYLVSPDPAFTVSVSGLPGPCIHCIWSPQDTHSLYLVSQDTQQGLQDPAFTVSGLPNAIIQFQ